MNPNGGHFRPGVESLESRCLLAGNVTADIIKGNLVLKGDADGNSVQITNSAPGVLAVSGLGTMINGSGLTEEFSGFTGNVVARFKGGADALVLVGVQLPGSLTFHGGTGNNNLALLNSSTVARNVKFLGGPEADSLSLTNTDIGRNLVFKGTEGDDIFSLGFARVGGNAVFNLGTGTGVAQGGILSVTDIFGNLTIRAVGPTNAQVSILSSTTIFGATSVVTGGGEDSLEIGNSVFYKSVVVEMGGNADTVSIATAGGDVVFNGKFDLKTQGGDDTVTLGSAGMFEAAFNKRTRLNGGGGTNILNENEVDMGPNYKAINFGP